MFVCTRCEFFFGENLDEKKEKKEDKMFFCPSTIKFSGSCARTVKNAHMRHVPFVSAIYWYNVMV